MGGDAEGRCGGEWMADLSLETQIAHSRMACWLHRLRGLDSRKRRRPDRSQACGGGGEGVVELACIQ